MFTRVSIESGLGSGSGFGLSSALLYLTLSIIPTAVLAQTPTHHVADHRLTSVHTSDVIWNGVTVDDRGRIFVVFPHLEGSTGTRLGEIANDNSIHPYPDAAWNAWAKDADSTHTFVHLNSARLGPDGNLWAVDTGTPAFGDARIDNAAKLVVIDTSTNTVIRIYPLQAATDAHSYVDDVRFHDENAYLTDAGSPGLIILNLKTGATRRVLDHTSSTTQQRQILAEGKVVKAPDGKDLQVNADQMEVSPDGRYFYFQPVSGPLSRVETRYLDDPSITEAELEKQVKTWVDTPSTGGTAIDHAGNIYLSDVNRKRILKITPAGKVTTLIEDPRLLWIDAMWIDNHGYLWMPSGQINRMSLFQNGVDRVELPVHLYKLYIGGKPIR